MSHLVADPGRIRELPRSSRRLLAALAVAGYPVAVLFLTQAPQLGVPAPVAGGVALIGIGITLFAMWRCYAFRGKLAQAPDDRLDEREIRIRDRAYLESYRLFVLAVLVALVAVAIIPDVLDRPITLDYATLNWFIMGAILVSLALPSAVVAWVEPDVDEVA